MNIRREGLFTKQENISKSYVILSKITYTDVFDKLLAMIVSFKVEYKLI